MLILLLSMYAFSVAHQQSLLDAETFVETIFLIFNPQFLVSFLGCCVLCNKGQVAWLPCSAQLCDTHLTSRQWISNPDHWYKCFHKAFTGEQSAVTCRESWPSKCIFPAPTPIISILFLPLSRNVEAPPTSHLYAQLTPQLIKFWNHLNMRIRNPHFIQAFSNQKG